MILGHTYSDLITGFSGVAIGYVQYITGCNQVLLVPRVTAEGALVESAWFDEQRLALVPETPRIVVNNGQTPGFGPQAPKK